MNRRRTLRRGSLVFSAFLSVVLLLLGSAAALAQATIATDQSDYVPGDTVHITGAGWVAEETVSLVLTEDPYVHPPDTLYAAANSAGSIRNDQYIIQTHDIGQTFTLVATGLLSGRTAQATFTDNPKVGSVVVGSQSPASLCPGSSATYTVTVSRGSGGGSTGAFEAALSVTSMLPAGATASFSPNPLSFTPTMTSLTSTLTILTSSATPTGATTATVKAATSATDTASGNGTLSVTSPISSHPASISLCAGSAAAFSVTVSGAGLSYQWRRNGANLSNGGNISGATSATLTVTPAGVSDAASYDVVVSGACATPVTSISATLTVNTAPAITLEPTGATTCLGEPVTFTVAASGTALSYQWRKGGVGISGATASSLTIASVAAGDAGSYDVVVSGSCTPSATSMVASLVVNTPPSISSSAASATKCVGEAVTFSVTASGTWLTYQWRKGGAGISGATSSSYTIASVMPGDAGSYDVVVSGTCALPATSSSASLAVDTPPSITGNPSDATACIGGPVTFTVSAAGSGLSYQWRKGGVDIPSATGSSHTLASVASGDAGTYDAVVSGTCAPNAASATATLTVNTPPSISSSPASATKCVGESVTFSVTASGTGLTYQWRKGGVGISGATSSSYTIASVTAGDAGSYDVVVSGTCASPATSSSASLAVDTPPSISGNPTDGTACISGPVTFTVAASGTSLSYQWRKDEVSISGATASSLTIASVAAGDAGSYDVVVSGSCTPTATSGTATLTVNTPPSISSSPASATKCVGESVTFTVSATGSGLAYQWRKGGVNISGATSSSFTIPAVAEGDAGSYDAVVSGICGSPATSGAAGLAVNTPASISADPLGSSKCPGESATFSATAQGTALSYQWRKGGSAIPGATGSSYTIASVVAGDAGTYDVIVAGVCGSPSTSGSAVLTVSTGVAISAPPASQVVCSGASASFSVTASGSGLVYQWRKGGLAIAGATASSYALPTVAEGDAGSYDVVVGGTCGAPVTSSAASLTVNTSPTISTNPSSASKCSGEAATFSVTATGTGLSYQWRKGGIDISGATSSSYTLPSVAAGDAGAYDIVVSGSCAPPATSAAATLTVNAAPLVTGDPSSATICAGEPATFTATASGTGLTFQWRKGGVNIPGATGANYTISSATPGDAGTYDVVVSGLCASPATSSAATLTISTAAAITGQPSGQTLCAGGAASFTVVATGSGLTYQWRKGGVTIAGATGSTYAIPATVAADAGSYDVIVSGMCGAPATSSAADLTINTPASISGQTLDATKCAGESVTFSVTAAGSGLAYQWRKGGVNIPGATGSSYTIASVLPADAGSFDVVVTGSCGSPQNSSAVALTITTGVAITGQPGAQVACPGGSADFSVSATGSGLTYQWRKNGVNIAGATADNLAIPSVTPGDAGSYDVIVGGTCGTPVTSWTATLSVNSAPAITGEPTSAAKCTGESVTFSVTATGSGLAYQWRKGGVTIPGATGSSYAIVSVAAGDAGSYDVSVSGACAPPATSATALLTVHTPPSISEEPVAATKCVGEPVTFSVTAAGSSLIYQWRKGGVNIPGATSSSYAIATVVAGDVGAYDVVVTGLCAPAVTSTAAALTLSAGVSISGQPAGQVACAGGSATFSVTAGGSGLSYQWRKAGLDIAGATGSSFTIPVVAAADAGSFEVIVSGTCGSPLGSSTALLVVDTPPTISAQPSGQTVCPGGIASFSVTAQGSNLVYQWRKEGINIAGASGTSYTIPSAAAGDAGSYDVTVSGSCGSPISSTVAVLTVATGVTISGQPGGQTVCLGASATFSVTAAGGGLTYQWRKGGTNLPGALGSAYTIPSVAAGDAGSYDVIVSGSCGSPVTSSAAVLALGLATTITAPPLGATRCVGEPMAFSITASGSTVSYQWRKNGAAIGGATGSSYAIAAVAAGDAGVYDVVLGNLCGAPVVSDGALLAVHELPVVTGNPGTLLRITGESASFSVTAAGPGLTYQWRKNGAPLGGAIFSSYSIPAVATGDVGAYDVVVSSSCGDVISAQAILSVVPGGGDQVVIPVHLVASGPAPRDSTSIFFGVHTLATYCIDLAVGEFELPPLPPAGTFGIRLVDSRSAPGACFGAGLALDLRPYTSSAQIDTYKIQFQPGSAGYPMTISWGDLNPYFAGPVRLLDLSGGATIDLDMKAVQSTTVSDSLIHQLLIIAQGPTDDLLAMQGQYRTFGQLDYSQKSVKRKLGRTPTAANVRDETYVRMGWFSRGLVLGVPRKDSTFEYSWLYWKRNTSRLARYLPHSGQARGFDSYFSRHLWHHSRYNPLLRYHDNHLAGEQFILKFNVGASDVGITPPGFGDLVFNDPTLPSNPCNGMSVRQIVAHTDTALTMSKWFSASHFVELDSCLSRVNRSFEGVIGAFTDIPLTVAGARPLWQVPYLHPNPSPSPVVIPAYDVTAENEEPASYTLLQNYPNPFNPSTTIRFVLAEPSVVTLKVYNVLGEEVAVPLEQAEMGDGMQEVEFHGGAFSSGVYFYRIASEGIDAREDGVPFQPFTSVKKMVLLK